MVLAGNHIIDFIYFIRDPRGAGVQFCNLENIKVKMGITRPAMLSFHLLQSGLTGPSISGPTIDCLILNGTLNIFLSVWCLWHPGELNGLSDRRTYNPLGSINTHLNIIFTAIHRRWDFGLWPLCFICATMVRNSPLDIPRDAIIIIWYFTIYFCNLLYIC